MRAERGSATVLVVASTGIVLACAVAVTSVAGLYVARTQAANAADAAALAAAVATFPPASTSQPWVVAGETARQNGATLVRCTCSREPGMGVRVVEVVTRVVVEAPLFGDLGVEQAARAEFDPVRWLAGR